MARLEGIADDITGDFDATERAAIDEDDNNIEMKTTLDSLMQSTATMTFSGAPGGWLPPWPTPDRAFCCPVNLRNKNNEVAILPQFNEINNPGNWKECSASAQKF